MMRLMRAVGTTIIVPGAVPVTWRRSITWRHNINSAKRVVHEPVYDPVEKDAAGVSKMLISEEDIKTGLVDANGKKLAMNAGTKGLVGATASAIEKLAPILGTAATPPTS